MLTEAGDGGCVASEYDFAVAINGGETKGDWDDLWEELFGSA
jgi:hypothetical protein